MTLTVHHYFPLGSENTGDALVARAIRSALAARLGACRFVDMPVNNRLRSADRPIGLRGPNLERTNAEADVVVIGGSNLLEPRRDGRWGVDVDLASIERLRPPLLLVGMGTGSDFGRAIPRYRPRTAETIRALFDRAAAAAVRDLPTARRLAAIGVRVPCVGCPVMFLTPRPVRPVGADAPLLVSFPPVRILKRRSGRRFMRGAMRFIRRQRDAGVPVVVTLHDSRDVEPARTLVPDGVERFFTDDLDELVRRFETGGVVVGFRLHACLLALGLGRPAVPVGVDGRGIGLIETFDLADVSMRASDHRRFRRLEAIVSRLRADDAPALAVLERAKSLHAPRFEAFMDAAALVVSN